MLFDPVRRLIKPMPTISPSWPISCAYEKLMAHWRAVLPEGVMLEVRYERLVERLRVPGAPRPGSLRLRLGRRLSRFPQDRAAGAVPPARARYASRSTIVRSANGAHPIPSCAPFSTRWQRAVEARFVAAGLRGGETESLWRPAAGAKKPSPRGRGETEERSRHQRSDPVS